MKAILVQIKYSSMQKQVCLVCLRSDEEVKIVLHLIRKKLQKISNQYIPDYREQTDTSRAALGFSRLLSVAMAGKPTSNQQFHRCPHDKFSRYLRRKLKCDNVTFNELCNELVQQIAERNYHIEVLNTQIRNFSETCLRLAETKEAEALRTAQDQKRESRNVVTMASVVSQGQMIRTQVRAEPVCQAGSFNAVPILFVGMAVNAHHLMDSSLFLKRQDNN